MIKLLPPVIWIFGRDLKVCPLLLITEFLSCLMIMQVFLGHGILILRESYLVSCAVNRPLVIFRSLINAATKAPIAYRIVSSAAVVSLKL